MDSRTRELIAVGASVCANCGPCLQYHLAKAREGGAGDREVATAIAVAKAVRKGAAAKMDGYLAGLGTAAATEKEAAGECSCAGGGTGPCC